MSARLDTSIVVNALTMALEQRRPAGGGHSSLRSRMSIHLDRVRPALSRRRSATFHGIGRRLL
jgi:hypothetical protein